MEVKNPSVAKALIDLLGVESVGPRFDPIKWMGFEWSTEIKKLKSKSEIWHFKGKNLPR